MTIKYDVTTTYASESEKIRILSEKYPLSTSPGTWASTSSSTTYTYTNEADLLSQLLTALNDNSMTATDFNNKADRNGGDVYFANSGGTDSYVVSSTPNYVQYLAYSAGMIIRAKADVGNTGSATLNVDGLGAKTIKKITVNGLSDLETGDILTNQIFYVIYDGTYFQLINSVLNPCKFYETTLTGSASSISITIPSVYKTIHIWGNLINDTTDYTLRGRFNGDTASNYGYSFYRNNGSGASGSSSGSESYLMLAYLLTHQFGVFDLKFQNNNVSERKEVLWSAGGTASGGKSYWANTSSAVSTLLLYPSTNNFKTGSYISCWGYA